LHHLWFERATLYTTPPTANLTPRCRAACFYAASRTVRAYLGAACYLLLTEDVPRLRVTCPTCAFAPSAWCAQRFAWRVSCAGLTATTPHSPTLQHRCLLVPTRTGSLPFVVDARRVAVILMWDVSFLDMCILHCYRTCLPPPAATIPFVLQEGFNAGFLLVFLLGGRRTLFASFHCGLHHLYAMPFTGTGMNSLTLLLVTFFLANKRLSVRLGLALAGVAVSRAGLGISSLRLLDLPCGRTTAFAQYCRFMDAWSSLPSSAAPRAEPLHACC